MGIFQRKPALDKEWEVLQKREERFLKKREEKPDSFLNQKLAEKVPEKLQKTLDIAFEKAFALVFEKGTGIIEKTYHREALEQDYEIRRYTAEIRKNRKSLQEFSKKAAHAGTKNLMLSGITGIGMGVLGVGIPDIPVFTGLILKNIYEIALSYGYEYRSEKEQYFILLLIQGGVSYGEQIQKVNQQIDEYIDTGAVPENNFVSVQIKETAALLSKELLYMKFLQGIPVVGAVGGAYDIVYMKQTAEYAQLKYRRRFLKERLDRQASGYI